MSVDISNFNPFDPRTQQCPFPHYAKMRAEAPVHAVDSIGVHMVTKHDLVMQVLRDPQILVMDEATSSIDTATERLVQAGVEECDDGNRDDTDGCSSGCRSF